MLQLRYGVHVTEFRDSLSDTCQSLAPDLEESHEDA